MIRATFINSVHREVFTFDQPAVGDRRWDVGLRCCLVPDCRPGVLRASNPPTGNGNPSVHDRIHGLVN